MTQQNSPAARAIAAFGGVPDLIKGAGIPKKTVQGWLAPADQKGGDGRIPAKWQGPILKAARRLGLSLTAEDLIDMRTSHVRAAEDVQ